MAIWQFASVCTYVWKKGLCTVNYIICGDVCALNKVICVCGRPAATWSGNNKQRQQHQCGNNTNSLKWKMKFNIFEVWWKFVAFVSQPWEFCPIRLLKLLPFSLKRQMYACTWRFSQFSRNNLNFIKSLLNSKAMYKLKFNEFPTIYVSFPFECFIV